MVWYTANSSSVPKATGNEPLKVSLLSSVEPEVMAPCVVPTVSVMVTVRPLYTLATYAALLVPVLPLEVLSTRAVKLCAPAPTVGVYVHAVPDTVALPSLVAPS